MSETQDNPLPVLEDEPEVGERIPPLVSFIESDNAIAERLHASGFHSGYAGSELIELVKDDHEYQRLCQLRTELLNESPLEPNAIRQAEKEAKAAFRRWQLMKARPRLRRDEMLTTQKKMFHQMRMTALTEASKSIRRIQSILGLPYLNREKDTPEFLTKLSGRRASQGMAIARLLREPLESPKTSLTDELPPIPNSPDSILVQNQTPLPSPPETLM